MFKKFLFCVVVILCFINITFSIKVSSTRLNCNGKPCTEDEKRALELEAAAAKHKANNAQKTADIEKAKKAGTGSDAKVINSSDEAKAKLAKDASVKQSLIDAKLNAPTVKLAKVDLNSQSGL